MILNPDSLSSILSLLWYRVNWLFQSNRITSTDEFYLFCFLILAAVFIVILYLRISRFQKEKRQQQTFAQQLIENQELERKRIAQELHDSLGQNILIMKTNAELALRKIDNREAVLEHLREIVSVSADTLQIGRDIAYNLRPLHLDRLGITETLRTLLESVGKATTMVLDQDIDDIDGCISQDNEINFYRIVQETFNNIIKHSNASVASIKIRKTDGAIVMTIQDNGKGYQMHSVKTKRGMGLVGIEERAHILNAKLSVYSEEGRGTRVSLSIPLTIIHDKNRSH